MSVTMHWTDWLGLLGHFMTLSLLAVGGGVSVVLPGMHRYLVVQQLWLTEAQFSSSVALAQLAPGPNVLFVVLMGWNIGINAGGTAWALLGASLCLVGIVLPSSLLTLFATRWAQRRRDHRGLRAFRLGLTPLVLALLASTAWLLLAPAVGAGVSWRYALAGAVAVALLWKTRLHLLWVMAGGALLGATGWV